MKLEAREQLPLAISKTATENFPVSRLPVALATLSPASASAVAQWESNYESGQTLIDDVLADISFQKEHAESPGEQANSPSESQKVQLFAAVDIVFDARQKIQANEIALKRKQLEEFSSWIYRREKDRLNIVAARVDELVSGRESSESDLKKTPQIDHQFSVSAAEITVAAAGTGEVDISVRQNHSDEPHPGTEDAKRTVQEFVEGAIIGIGIELRVEGESLIVNETLPDSPAEAVGIKAKDKLVSVDGVEVMDLASSSRLNQAVKLMRGKAGDEVSLKLVRDGKSIDVGVKLREILSKSVKQMPTIISRP